MLARILVFVGLVSAAYAVARLGFGPPPASLTILEIRGSNQQQGREGTSDIYGIDTGVVQPIDLSTGQPAGIRFHDPLAVLKEIDRASPLLHEALVIGRVLSSVTLDWYRVDPQTQQEDGYYVITLTQARVVEIETFMPVSFLPSNEPYRHMERVAFTYQGVEWKWIPDSSPHGIA
jgi:type VI secretion system secreted protein Hcp